MDFKLWLQKFGTDRQNKVLGGVCAGLALGTPMPVWVWRLLLVLLALVYGSGIILYLVLWIILPGHQFTPADIARNRDKAVLFFKRTHQGKWIAGICSGLEAWSQIPAWVYRLVFILLAIAGFGTGILLYLAMWVFVPGE
jgi:phage shock protein PspC (stress-responsive transcriptional regulator)